MDFSSLKAGCYTMIKNRVCKLSQVKFSKPGKHGGAKKVVIGSDVINDKKYTEIFRHATVFHHFTMDTLIYSLVYVEDDGTLVMLNNQGQEVNDYSLPEGELGQTVKKLAPECPLVHVLKVKSEFQDDYRIIQVVHDSTNN